MSIVVKPLWDRAFRVNVYKRTDFSSRIIESYFVKTDTKGLVLTSSPNIDDNRKAEIEGKIRTLNPRKETQSEPQELAV